MPLLERAALADLPAFRFGHAENARAGTGCTVVLAPAGATCGVDVRGGGPATRETDLLRPENMIEAVHAVVLAGGSAFGLEASCGVMDELAARGIGFPVEQVKVPIVVGACLFDLLVGESTHPDKAMGRAAAAAAFAEGASPLAEGNVGAGCGATVGKLLGGARAMKSGFGYATVRLGTLVVGALVAVNALGCVCDSAGTWIAGCRDADGRVLDPLAAFGVLAAEQAALATAGATSASEDATDQGVGPCANTTLGVVVTNARLTKAQATKVASTAHDAYARAIKPVHTSNDGDTIFALAAGEVATSPDLVAVAGTEALQLAIARAVTCARGAFGLPAACDIARAACDGASAN